MTVDLLSKWQPISAITGVDMGGFGSGRQDQIRTTGSVESATRFDIRTITKAMAGKHNHWLPLETAEAFSLYARISNGLVQISRLKPTDKHLYAELKLVSQPRHFGGHQPYLLCPHCNEKACILYLIQPKEIGCRKCLNLAYDSQYYRHPAPKLLKANKLRVQLGGKSGLLNPLPERPKGMHLDTYERALRKILELESSHVTQSYESMRDLRSESARLVSRYSR